jgi:hypothetical protein
VGRRLREFLGLAARETPGAFVKVILEAALITAATLLAAGLIALLGQIFGEPITWQTVRTRLESLVIAIWSDPFTYTVALISRNPVHSFGIFALVGAVFVFFFLLRKAQHKIKTLQAAAQETADEGEAAQLLVAQLGIGGRWPRTGRNKADPP